MGAITFSIDERLLDFLVTSLGIEVFVETGTFEGDSLAIASRKLGECHSVEAAPDYHEAARRRFDGQPGVHLTLGESPDFLRGLAPRLAGRSVLYWLDAHWCLAGGTSHEDSQSPLLQELEAIAPLDPSSVICIDDARLYLSPPPAPHRHGDWPDLDDVLSALRRCSPDHRTIVLNDVLIVYPAEYREAMRQLAFRHGVDWLRIADRVLRPQFFRRERRPRVEVSGSTSGGRLPIGVVLPTLNSISLLPEHVKTMNEWIDRVEEIVVVDSESTDGTVEFLRRELQHPNIRFFSRPRGLYQAWNFGVEQIRSPYTYFSTVGDTITREGLLHLHETAEAFSADVVISNPCFVDERGHVLESMAWPVEALLEVCALEEPGLLDRWITFGFSFLTLPGTILGSSASNLYRTSCLESAPFPLEFGTTGDSAWLLENALRLDVVLTPHQISAFRRHEKSYDPADYAVEDLIPRLEKTAERSFQRALAEGDGLRTTPEARAVETMIRERARAVAGHAQLMPLRTNGMPRGLNRASVQARLLRRARNRARRRVEQSGLALVARASRADAASVAAAMKPILKHASRR